MERDQGDLYSAIVPTTPEMSPDTDTTVQYYIVVQDGEREVLTEGTAARPHEFLVGRVEGLPDRTGDGRRVREREGGGFPWLIVGLSGVAAIGLGVGAFFLLSSTAEEEAGQALVHIGPSE
jgi:hypothetical protein